MNIDETDITKRFRINTEGRKSTSKIDLPVFVPGISRIVGTNKLREVETLSISAVACVYSFKMAARIRGWVV